MQDPTEDTMREKKTPMTSPAATRLTIIFHVSGHQASLIIKHNLSVTDNATSKKKQEETKQKCHLSIASNEITWEKGEGEGLY